MAARSIYYAATGSGLGGSRVIFPIPVLTGIEHQKNVTIVDLMAHEATITPSKAEFIIAYNRGFEDGLLDIR
jgi:exodeoxyribonuclease VII large subunit